MLAIAARRDTAEVAAPGLRAVHRREVLRLALGQLVGIHGPSEIAAGLHAAHTALLEALLAAIRTEHGRHAVPGLEIALIGMGRYGGEELGFASDVDLLAVYRAPAGTAHAAEEAASVISELRRLAADPRFPLELDFDLRPEGKNGPFVRSLDAYRNYYERWSLTWEAQALLRARPVAGDSILGADFMRLADSIRYPKSFGDAEAREVRRLKARVESERLPQGADPKRHLKLGPGAISDVEWLLQLLQLQHAARVPELRTASTLEGLNAVVRAGLLDEESRETLETAWQLAGEIRSANRLWSGRGSDLLPKGRADLEGVGRILGLPTQSTTELEERYFSATRRARTVFEREFYGHVPEKFPLP
jgi:glutamate-ammonia-ligase adenylyltransferase